MENVSYVIRSYKEEYLEKHVEIGDSILSTWLGAQQTPIEGLRKAFSKDSFDPETKLYAFNDEEIVGFISSGISEPDENGKVTANMEFPLVLADHPDAELELVNAAFAVLKRKGVHQVNSRASPDWGKTVDFTKSLDYSFKEDLWISGRLDLKNYKQSSSSGNAREVNFDQDHEEIKNILVDFREMKEDAIDNYFSQLNSIKDRVVSWTVVEEDGKIVGHDVLVVDKFNPTKARMNAIYCVGDDPVKARNLVMDIHVSSALDANVDFIDIFFWGPTLQLGDDYKSYGFHLSPVSAFIKQL